MTWNIHVDHTSHNGFPSKTIQLNYGFCERCLPLEKLNKKPMPTRDITNVPQSL